MAHKLRPRQADLELLAEVSMVTGCPMRDVLRAAVEAWVATPEGAPWAVHYRRARTLYDRTPRTTDFGRRSDADPPPP